MLFCMDLFNCRLRAQTACFEIGCSSRAPRRALRVVYFLFQLFLQNYLRKSQLIVSISSWYCLYFAGRTVTRNLNNEL